MLPVVILVLAVIYCLVEVANADPERVRHAPRWLWAAAIIALPGVGSVAWFVFGRPVNTTERPKPQRRPTAPDDDPEFLRRLRDL